MILVLTVFNMYIPLTNGILGGTKIDIQKVPYQMNYGDVCGAVMIHPKWALTTAHCGKEDFLRIGSKYRLRGGKLKIDRHIVHPKFRILHMFDYDIQLLEFHRKLKITNYVSPIKIRNVKSEFIYIAGWGYEVEKGEYLNELHHVKLNRVSMAKCQSYEQKWYNHTLTDRMFCAGGMRRDACQGDSGGAAVSDGYLVGLASFGYGCGRNYPGVYLNVSNNEIREWIRNYTGV